MLVKTYINNDNGTKQELYKENDSYTIKYYEYDTGRGWSFICEETGLSEELVDL